MLGPKKHKAFRSPQKKSSQNSTKAGSRKTKQRLPRTLKQYSNLPAGAQENWNRAAHVISKMRAEKLSLPQASKNFGVDPRTVIRLTKSALRKDAKGHYVARLEDRLLRVLVIPSDEGLVEVAVNDSKQASLIGQYSDAVQKYLRTGDDSGVKKFERKRIKDASGKTVRFLTDLQQLKREGSAGVLSFESLYARTA